VGVLALLVLVVPLDNTSRQPVLVRPLRTLVLVQTVSHAQLVRYCTLVLELGKLMTAHVPVDVPYHQIAKLLLVMVRLAPLARLDTTSQQANVLNV